MNIERNTKVKLIADIYNGITSHYERCFSSSNKKKERGWTENFSSHGIMSDMLADSTNDK